MYSTAGPSHPFASSSIVSPFSPSSHASGSSTLPRVFSRMPRPPLRERTQSTFTCVEDPPTFTRLLGSMLGSPFLTTPLNLAEIVDGAGALIPSETTPDTELEPIDGAPLAVPRAYTVTRPPSPAPTADYSLISAPSSPTLRAADAAWPPPDAFTRHGGLGSPPAASLFGAQGMPYPTSPGSSGLGLGLGARRLRLSTPSKPRGLLPRLLDALAVSSPSKKGKARAHIAERTPSLDADTDYAALPPLDGEEGELVVIDEACFVPLDDAELVSAVREDEPARAATGVDMLTLFPAEIALCVLGHLGAADVLHCATVSRAWRALALDNLVWMDLFAARAGDGWRIDLSRLVPRGPGRGVGSQGGLIQRRASERSLVAAMARSRRISEQSVRSRMSARRGGLVAGSTLGSMAEEGCMLGTVGALDWRELYRTRAELDRRWAVGEPEVTKISGHADSVYCLEFDSTRIITGSRDRTIKVWELATGRLLGTFFGHAGSVLCLKFEPDWERLGPEGLMVSGSSDCTVLVWGMIALPNGDVRAEVRGRLTGHTGGVLDLRMDEQSIVTCSKDALVRVWDRETLQLRATLRGHEGPVNAVGLQGGRVVSASGDGKMILWDVHTGARIRTFEGHDRGLACIEFKDDLIVSGSNDCKIKVWDASTGTCITTLMGHSALVRALTFDRASGRLVSASYDRSVKVWDLRSGALLREFAGAHASHIFDVRFDCRRIVSTSHDQRIVVLDFGKGLDTELFV